MLLLDDHNHDFLFLLKGDINHLIVLIECPFGSHRLDAHDHVIDMILWVHIHWMSCCKVLMRKDMHCNIALHESVTLKKKVHMVDMTNLEE